MVVPGGTLIDPLANLRDFGVGQRLAGLLWRHLFVEVRRRQSSDDLACGCVTRNDGESARGQFGKGAFAVVQAEIRGAFRRVWSVTPKAVVRQQRANVTIEVDRVLGSSRGRQKGQQQQGCQDSITHVGSSQGFV